MRHVFAIAKDVAKPNITRVGEYNSPTDRVRQKWIDTK